jgi:hypothetical protein
MDASKPYLKANNLILLHICWDLGLNGYHLELAGDLQMHVSTDAQGRCFLPGGEELQEGDRELPENYIGQFLLIEVRRTN